MRDTEAERDRLIEGIYEASGEDGRWPAAMQQLAQWMRAFGGLYYLLEKRHDGQRVASMHLQGYSAADQLSYAAFYNSIDPHAPLVAQTPVQKWFLSHDHFNEQFRATDKFYQEYLEPRNVRWLTGTRLWENDDGIGLMAFNRYKEDSPFSSDDRLRLSSLVGHLARATQLHFRLMQNEFKSRLGAAAIQTLSFGMAMVDCDLRVLLSNSAAERIFKRTTIFAPSGDYLRLRSGNGGALLRQAIDGALDLKSSSLTLHHDGGRPAVHAAVMPLPAAAALNAQWQRPLALLVLTELDEPRRIPEGYLGELFDLTPAERKLAVAMVSGTSLECYAGDKGVSVETARKHLAALFAKTGTCRQGELIALLARLPAIGF